MTQPTNYTLEQANLLRRIAFTAELALADLREVDDGAPANPIHVTVMALSMIRMDAFQLLTGQDLFTKAIGEVIDEIAVPSQPANGVTK